MLVLRESTIVNVPLLGLAFLSAAPFFVYTFHVVDEYPLWASAVSPSAALLIGGGVCWVNLRSIQRTKDEIVIRTFSGTTRVARDGTVLFAELRQAGRGSWVDLRLRPSRGEELHMLNLDTEEMSKMNQIAEILGLPLEKKI